MRPLPSAVHIVTGVLLLNMLVAVMDLPVWVYFILFAAAPFLMVWLAWTVLRDRSVPMRDLKDGDEWGYQDRSDIAPVKD
jgi:membrane protein implicated in regulation of membrane protease activity